MIKIDQIAIGVPNLDYVMEHLKDLGITDWSEDEVVTDGTVHGNEAIGTKASLRFNYDLIEGKEFELLNYNEGENWHKHREDLKNGFGSINRRMPFLSHLGVHVDTVKEFESIMNKMDEKGYLIAQEVFTKSHTNEAIKDSRRYRYVIFDSHCRLGFDLKIILRLTKE